MSVYDWHDPWEAINQVQRFERDWYDREDEHRSQMRGMALAFADSTHEIRRHAEAMMEPALRVMATQNNPPPIDPVHWANLLKAQRK